MCRIRIFLPSKVFQAQMWFLRKYRSLVNISLTHFLFSKSLGCHWPTVFHYKNIREFKFITPLMFASKILPKKFCSSFPMFVCLGKIIPRKMWCKSKKKTMEIEDDIYMSRSRKNILQTS